MLLFITFRFCTAFRPSETRFGNAFVALRKCKEREGDAAMREVVLVKLPVAQAELRFEMHVSR